MTYLLDTNVISEGCKTRPDPAVSDWLGAVPSTELRLSVLTLGEVRHGIERIRRRDPAQASMFEGWIDEVMVSFAGSVVPVTVEIADAWGRMMAVRPLPAIDGLLGATALVHGWTLATRNTDDLAGTGVDLYDPWTFGLDG